MLPFISPILLAQLVTAPTSPLERQFVTQTQEIRPLSGKLNDVQVFNSNSPEVVQTEGILLSTYPPNGKYNPTAHLNRPLSGRFDFFSHHISRPLNDSRTLYQGVIVSNPTRKTITIRVLQAASYVTSPDAPFIDLPSQVEDPRGRIFSGPGSRLMGDILRGVNQNKFPHLIVIPPQQTRMIFSLPINTGSARSTFMRLESDGPVYMANLAMYGVPEVSLPDISDLAKQETLSLPPPAKLSYREPNLNEWRGLVITGRLAQPRDLSPTPLDTMTVDNKIYGRVAGISVGSEWVANLTDQPNRSYLSIPQRGGAFSYPVSSLNTGTHGTRQIQSAPMLVRYSDTAFLAHGNYAVRYNLTFPLRNNTNERQTVALTIQTPFKQDQYADRLFFVDPPQGQVFFRGTVRISYIDDRGQNQVRYFHLIQRQGQKGDPLIKLNMMPGEERQVTVDFLYPPDATPPQVVTVQTMELFYGKN